MHIVVCIKQILDPELPPQEFRIDPAAKTAVRGKASLVMSTFDEIALEVALRLRDKAGGGKITAVTLGPQSSEEVLRKALAMLCDDAVRIKEENLPPHDSFATARILAAAIRRLEPADLVLCGRQAGDTDAGQVGLLLAEELRLPTVTDVIEAEPAAGNLRFRREADSGFELVECRGPALATVTNAETNVPRIPKVKDMMMSHRKPLKVWSPEELGIAGVDVSHGAIRELYVPVRENKCEVISGEDPEELAAALVGRLVQLKAL